MLETLGLVANMHLARRDPISLVHFVTNRCNARCPFCFIDFDNPATFAGELNVDEIGRLTRTVGPSLRNVNLTGGEPFARRDLLDIARCWLRNTAVQSVYITSNGSLTERMLAFARTLAGEFPGRKLTFSISIDGPATEHDAIRRIDGLFATALASYHGLKTLGGDVLANVGITVSEANHHLVDALYDDLIENHGVRAIGATIVRDEGVNRVPDAERPHILAAYRRVTRRIAEDLASGRLEGFDKASLQGRLMNHKNVVVNKIISETWLKPRYVSPCHAAALFGVIAADGTVHPCEILDRPLGRLRDFGMDFGALWRDEAARSARHFIRDSKCHCSYECAWTLNVLGNARYQPGLIAAALGKTS